MKPAFLLLFLCISFSVYAQSHVDSTGACIISGDDKVFTKSETAPSFPKKHGGLEAYMKKNFNTQAALAHGAPKGTYQVRVRLIVLKDGNYCDFQPESTNGFGIEEEAIRVLKNGPKWKHAVQNGYPVHAYARPIFEIEL